MVAWQRVRANRGSRSAGVDRQNAYDVETRLGVERFLGGLREELRAGSFRPVSVKERLIPKRGGKLRRLGIPTVRDRVVQAALKLVLEPIFEADFQPCSYGFRPGRRAQDAIAEIHHLTSSARNYEWIVEADIEACFDRIDHAALVGRVSRRIADKRVLALIKAFLRAGILTEHGGFEDTVTGTPQGGILSPLLANIALSALDEHFARAWAAMGSEWQRRKRERAARRPSGWCATPTISSSWSPAKGRHAEALVAETAAVLAPLGLTLSPEKTRITHIDEGIEFLGWRLQRHRASNRRRYVYTYAVQAVASGGQGQGQGDHALRPASVARPAAAPAQPGAARLVRLLSRRSVRADLQLPARLHVAAGSLLASPQTPQGELALAETALPPEVVADRRRDGALRPRLGADRVLPLPRGQDRHAMGAGPLPTRPRADARATANPDRPMTTGMSVESRMRGNSHVRFGGRPGETDRP